MIVKNHRIVLKDTSPAEMARFRQFFLDIWRQQIEDDKNSAEMEKFIKQRYEKTLEPDKKYTTTWLGEVVLNNDIRSTKNKNNPKENIFESFTENNIDNIENQSVDLVLNGHFYTKEGKYLGKINAGDNVYITDEIAFLEIGKGKKVLKDIISNSTNSYKLDNSPFTLEIEKRKNEIIHFTEKYGLNNTQMLDRANWAFAEGNGALPEYYVFAMNNLRKLAGSEKDLYYYGMQDSDPTTGATRKLEKNKYLSGEYENKSGILFWNARKDLTKMTSEMMAEIAAVFKSHLQPDKDPTGGCNQWRGGKGKGEMQINYPAGSKYWHRFFKLNKKYTEEAKIVTL